MLTIDDRLEIIDLYGRYNHRFDSGDADGWAALFTPDGTFTRRAGGGGSAPYEASGTAGLAASLRKRSEELYKKRGIRHVVSNIVIDPTESGARGTAYVLAMRVGDQQPPLVIATGRYADELTKDTQGWRFRSRTFLPDI